MRELGQEVGEANEKRDNPSVNRSFSNASLIS